MANRTNVGEVYCADCEYMVKQLMGLCESSVFWCGAQDTKEDHWLRPMTVHNAKCKKINKHNDCRMFRHK